MGLYQFLILKSDGQIVFSINLSEDVVSPQKSAEFIKDAYLFAEETLRQKITTIKTRNRLFVLKELGKDMLMAVMTDENEYETIELNAEKIIDFLYETLKKLDAESIKNILSSPEVQKKIVEILKSNPRYFMRE